MLDYTPRIIEYLLDHYYDDSTHLTQVEWRTDLSLALDWLKTQPEHRALLVVADGWLRGETVKETTLRLNAQEYMVEDARILLCHVLADWLNDG